MMITITSKQTVISENLDAGTVTLSYERFKDGEPFGNSGPMTFKIGKVTSVRGTSLELGRKIFRKKFVKLKDGSYGYVALV